MTAVEGDVTTSSVRHWPHIVGWTAVILLLTTLQLLRQSGIPPWRSLWAEDGPVFLASASDLGALVRGYSGYEHLLPRLIALGSVPVPAAWLSRYFAIVPALVTAALSVALYPLSASAIPSRTLRAVLVASATLVPAAVEENLASATYTIWIALFACYWALLSRPRARWHVALACGVAFLGAASNVLALLFIPLALWLGWSRRDRTTGAVLGAFATGLVLQVIVSLSSPGIPNHSSRVQDVPALYAVRVLGSALFGEDGTRVLWTHAGYAYAALVAVFVLGGLVFLTLRASRDARVLGLITLGYSVVLFAVPVYIRGTVLIRLTADTLSFSEARFATISILFLMSGGFILLAHAQLDLRVRRWLVIAVTAYFVIVATVGFRMGNPRSDGPEWAAALRTAQVSCRTEDRTDIVIPIAPAGWYVGLPCDRIE